MVSLGFLFGLVCFRLAFALVSFGFAWLSLWSRLVSLGFRVGLVWFRLAFALDSFVLFGFALVSIHKKCIHVTFLSSSRGLLLQHFLLQFHFPASVAVFWKPQLKQESGTEAGYILSVSLRILSLSRRILSLSSRYTFVSFRYPSRLGSLWFRFGLAWVRFGFALVLFGFALV